MEPSKENNLEIMKIVTWVRILSVIADVTGFNMLALDLRPLFPAD